MDWINNNAISASQKGLDVAWQKQRVILDNIANNETPGYKAKYITFEDELNSRLSGFNDKAEPKKSAISNVINSSKMRIHDSQEESIRMDGNNVNIDVESTELARTQYQYQYLVRQISDQFTRLRMVIDGR